MATTPVSSSKRALDPNERISEVLFGLIMVLTFTGSLSVADAGGDDVRVMLIGALGCNFAWGIIDGIFYLMGSLAEKGSNLMTYRAVRSEPDPRKARDRLAQAMPSVIASVLTPAELDGVHQRLRDLPEPPARARLAQDDWRGAVTVFILVVLSTFPVAIPFIFMDEILPAMRVSNAIAIVMLFGTGFAYARIVGGNPWLLGFAMVILGSILVSMTIFLGG
ncbi:MAG: VIT1/CCC1 transporter family protein [Opitutaceae bacterium]